MRPWERHGGDELKLQASSVPDWTIAQAVTRMRGLDIPVRQSSLVRAAIAAFIGLDDEKVREIAVGEKPVKERTLTLDEFIDDLERTQDA
jgi:hypothetical protein